MRLMVYILGRDEHFCEACGIVTLLALADLAVNPSLDVDYFFPNEVDQTMQTLFPGQRFAWACMAATRTKSIAQRIADKGNAVGCLETAYKEFISDCCEWLKWVPPWVQAERWLRRYPTFSAASSAGFGPLDHFLEGCRLRLEAPLFFGIPSHAVRHQGNGAHTWLALLQKYLTIPHFASRESFPVLSIGGAVSADVLPQQYDAMTHSILDQLMLCSGPLDWEIILNPFGRDTQYNELIVTKVKRSLLAQGLDLDTVVY